ncbi:YhcN/YlaJ family sporulation lipoprotein [Paenibacillus sp.]|uniref:YhcN/YlaJ family sporulation lipoprotein n=1 Tax=Paenibacillus sp. TaxID=58172 RepID=UPI002810D8EE|nr:YhcN/YlaJ family sporulation lipoprotein [Paenibacillus sp.]
MRKQFLGLSGTLFLTLTVVSACSGNGGAGAEAKQTDDTYRVRVQQSAPERDEERSRATEARLEQLAESIQEVKHANCVIVGDTAIVGIDVGGDVERTRVGTIKYAVAEALRKDPVGINAIVTADMDLNHRLQEIRQDMQNGRPMQGIAEELADIVGRIVPQLPRDIEQRRQVPNDPKAATQEQGVKEIESSRDGQSNLPSNAGEPRDNRDFADHPNSR